MEANLVTGEFSVLLFQFAEISSGKNNPSWVKQCVSYLLHHDLLETQDGGQATTQKCG